MNDPSCPHYSSVEAKGACNITQELFVLTLVALQPVPCRVKPMAHNETCKSAKGTTSPGLWKRIQKKENERETVAVFPARLYPTTIVLWKMDTQ